MCSSSSSPLLPPREKPAQEGRRNPIRPPPWPNPLHVLARFQIEPYNPNRVRNAHEHPRQKMVSGLVRIALECERRGGYATASSGGGGKSKGGNLLEETLWRTYCNGKKCGYAVRRELGEEDFRVLKAVEPVTMGAGVVPAAIDGVGDEGEMMYMRARFERVIGLKDSEAMRGR